MSKRSRNEEAPAQERYLQVLVKQETQEVVVVVKEEEASDNEIEEQEDMAVDEQQGELALSVERACSRSPIGQTIKETYLPAFMPPNVLIQVGINEDGEPLEDDEGILNTVIKSETDTQLEQCWEADAHALCKRSISDDDSDSNGSDGVGYNCEADRRNRVRGRVRGERKKRAPRALGSGQPRYVSDQPSFAVGKPIEEIWSHDEDVPSEVMEMVLKVVKQRQAVAQKKRERLLRKHERDRGKGDESESEDEELAPSQASSFQWLSMDTFNVKEERFTEEITGSVQTFSTAYDAFRSYWDDKIIQFITDKTNQYASNILSPAFKREWYPTNSHEVLCLFAFWMMLGIIRMPTITSCFSTDPLLKTDVFRRIFTKTRYMNLTRALFPYQGLFHLKPIFDHLNEKFQANYIPSKNICVDESVTFWAGKNELGPHSVSTPACNRGVQVFELCESTSGYLWSFVVSAEKTVNSTAVVQKLVSPLLNKGYRLFLEKWYNSPYLARFLKRNGTDCVGLLRPNRTDVPDVVTLAPLKQGQLIARHSDDVCVLSWQDKERATMISTCHDSSTAWSTVPSKKVAQPLPFIPQVVLDYEKWMRGVDLSDHILEPYLLERNHNSKWHLSLFKRLLNCSINNARILLESSMQGRAYDNSGIRLQLVDSLLHHHLPNIARSNRPSENQNKKKVTPKPPAATRMSDHTHWLVRNPQREADMAKNRQTRMPCVVCIREGRKFVKSPFRCEACNVPLCVEYCYKAYHITDE